METTIYPPSIQSDLFAYLKEEQQVFIRPVLRMLKKRAQEELCCMLLDYLETGAVEWSSNILLDSFFTYVTRYEMSFLDDLSDPRIIRPLVGKHPVD